ncbi:MAG TPA: peptidoglycan DD-metalloendopeptidase family protein [Vicinamibacterales bacterium]|nr:peptidoglycan DD-metalloendopeptidase family protein [Vicinamibacterales bacterium]
MTGRVMPVVFVLMAIQAPTPVTVTVDARALAPGELVVLTIATHEPAGAVHVRAFDQDWPAFAVDDRTWRAIVGIDLDVAPGEHRVGVRVDSRSGPERRTETLSVEPRTFRTRTLTVDPAFVNPPEQVQARIAAEATELDRLWRSSNPAPYWTGAFVRPVPHEANSAFGTRSIFNGQARSPHGGADFLSPAGTPVASPGAGRVLLARDRYYTGGSVVIDHGAGLISLFAHLSSIDVAPGDLIEAGQPVGKVGATGRVTGAHLHWTLRASGTRVDPLSLLHVLGAGRQASARHPLPILNHSISRSSINHQ